MKKKNVPLIIAISLAVLFVFCLFGFFILSFFMAPRISVKNDIKYYSNDENYASNIGVVEGIMYHDGVLTLEIYDRKFSVTENSEKALRANDFYEEVRLDSKITYVTLCDAYAGRTSYIVAIEYNGKTYLDFETGKNNLLEYLRGLL